MFKNEYGILYVVSTPIGNMGDITLRAMEVLRDVDLVACEDTRHTGMLLSRLEIKKRLISYNDINERGRASVILSLLLGGKDVAVVSDAGTPGISDPAYRVVRAAVENGVTVQAVPGASALLAALVVSGLPLDRFVFEGFMPPKGAKREKRILSLASESRTVVFYESPHRIMDLLENILELIGDRDISVSREITKLHEETVRGKTSDVLAQLRMKSARGEYTVVMRGNIREKKDEREADNIRGD